VIAESGALGVISLLFDTLDEPLLGFAIAFLDENRGQSQGLAVLVGGSVVVGGIVGATVLALRGGARRGIRAGSARGRRRGSRDPCRPDGSTPDGAV